MVQRTVEPHLPLDPIQQPRFRQQLAGGFNLEDLPFWIPPLGSDIAPDVVIILCQSCVNSSSNGVDV